jgi:GntR family transcriptional repressor for pyruvate dehydrogenase complex
MSDSETRIQPISRLTVSSSVAAELERLILEGDYKVGDQLPSERILVEQFGVGRSSMREARGSSR